MSASQYQYIKCYTGTVYTARRSAVAEDEFESTVRWWCRWISHRVSVPPNSSRHRLSIGSFRITALK